MIFSSTFPKYSYISIFLLIIFSIFPIIMKSNDFIQIFLSLFFGIGFYYLYLQIPLIFPIISRIICIISIIYGFYSLNKINSLNFQSIIIRNIGIIIFDILSFKNFILIGLLIHFLIHFFSKRLETINYFLFKRIHIKQ